MEVSHRKNSFICFYPAANRHLDSNLKILINQTRYLGVNYP